MFIYNWDMIIPLVQPVCLEIIIFYLYNCLCLYSIENIQQIILYNNMYEIIINNIFLCNDFITSFFNMSHEFRIAINPNLNPRVPSKSQSEIDYEEKRGEDGWTEAERNQYRWFWWTIGMIIFKFAFLDVFFDQDRYGRFRHKPDFKK